MKTFRWARVVSGIVICTWIMGAVAQTTDEAQRLQDWKRAADLFKQYYADLNTEYSFTGNEDAYLALWERWSEALPALQTDLKQRYGKTPEAVAASFEGLSAPDGVGNGMRQIAGELLDFDLNAKRKEIAGWCLTAGNQHYAKWKAFTSPDPVKLELKVDYAKRALAAYQRAGQIAPEGDYAESIKRAQKAIAETEGEWKAALKDLKWPGHNPEFAGPGDPDTLAKAALTFLASVDSWSKPEYDDAHIPIAACITAKGWDVNKTTPITKVPTQYSLNVFVAFKGTQDPDIAYAYHMVFYTREEEGVKKAPPFYYVNSRQYAKHKMLMANVPKRARIKVKAKPTTSGKTGEPDAATESGRLPPSAGAMGLVCRLLLSAVLLAAGCIGATALEKVTALTPVRETLASRRQPVGRAAMIVGILCFLRTTLFHFAPHADLLPQVLAVGLGLALASQSLPAPIATKLKRPIDLLTPLLPQLGLAALVLGVLHLLLAGVALI